MAIIDGANITKVYTDDAGYTWNILQRDGGSISLYATRPDAMVCFVAYDTLDNQPPNDTARGVLAKMAEMRTAIAALEAAIGLQYLRR